MYTVIQTKDILIEPLPLSSLYSVIQPQSVASPPFSDESFHGYIRVNAIDKSIMKLWGQI